MAEAKFTPGPWTPVFGGDWSVEPSTDEDTGACAWQQIAAGEKTIAIAVDGNPGWGTETRVLDANVRLIAAAPDLYEALKGAIGALEFSRDYHKDLGNEEQAFCQDRLDAALSALAKAGGLQ